MSPALTQLIERLCERLADCVYTQTLLGGRSYGCFDRAKAAEILVAELKPLVEDVRVPFRTADLIAKAFVPRNPNRMRNADPEVVQAAKDFLLAIDAAREANRQTQPNAQHNQKEQP